MVLEKKERELEFQAPTDHQELEQSTEHQVWPERFLVSSERQLMMLNHQELSVRPLMMKRHQVKSGRHLQLESQEERHQSSSKSYSSDTS